MKMNIIFNSGIHYKHLFSRLIADISKMIQKLEGNRVHIHVAKLCSVTCSTVDTLTFRGESSYIFSEEKHDKSL